ncbi:MFS transporter [Alkalihalobacillus sp. AL-G]|uniref:MFS transporter n=1 Tax=Alkalihalobacillus sp. AL-G TaxID=2926399 RepID=UPI002729D492|nr:MFS transporter [Alkalihalobacillus sp. AL-G]WLD92458.1 MFS transporter [Alkalihalobacillus sp. AL-G]
MKNSLLRNKSFVALISAQTISSIGDWLSIIAIFSLVGLRWEATPFEMSLVILSMALPMAVMGTVGGVIADRVERKFLMVASDVIRAILIIIISFASNLYVIYICLFFTGLLSALFMPAKNGKLKEILSDTEIKPAMAISSMIDSGSKIIGPLLSGLLVTFVGIIPVFYIDALTFIVSAIIIVLLPKGNFDTAAEHDTGKKKSFSHEIVLGFQFIRKNAFLFYGLMLLTISLLVLQLADSQIVILFREIENASPSLLGTAITGTGTGMLVVGAILSKKNEYPAFLYIVLGVVGAGVSFASLAALTVYNTPLPFLWAPGIAFVAGLSGGLVFIPFQANVQVETPVHMTGRVFGLINSIMMTATIIGPILGGWLATEFGIIPTFIATGSLLACIGSIAFLNRNRVERSDGVVTEGQRGTQARA